MLVVIGIYLQFILWLAHSDGLSYCISTKQPTNTGRSDCVSHLDGDGMCWKERSTITFQWRKCISSTYTQCMIWYGDQTVWNEYDDPLFWPCDHVIWRDDWYILYEVRVTLMLFRDPNPSPGNVCGPTDLSMWTLLTVVLIADLIACPSYHLCSDMISMTWYSCTYCPLCWMNVDVIVLWIVRRHPIERLQLYVYTKHWVISVHRNPNDRRNRMGMLLSQYVLHSFSVCICMVCSYPFVLCHCVGWCVLHSISSKLTPSGRVPQWPDNDVMHCDSSHFLPSVCWFVFSSSSSPYPSAVCSIDGIRIRSTRHIASARTFGARSLTKWWSKMTFPLYSICNCDSRVLSLWILVSHAVCVRFEFESLPPVSWFRFPNMSGHFCQTRFVTRRPLTPAPASPSPPSHPALPSAKHTPPLSGSVLVCIQFWPRWVHNGINSACSCGAYTSILAFNRIHKVFRIYAFNVVYAHLIGPSWMLRSNRRSILSDV